MSNGTHTRTGERALALWVVWSGLGVLCLIWGSTWLVIQQGLADLPPLTSLAARFVVAGVTFSVLAPWLSRREGGAAPGRGLTLAYALLIVVVPYGIIYQVETVLPSGLVSILWSTYPLLLAGCAHVGLPEERLRPRQWLGLLVGFAGAVLLFATDVTAVGAGALPAATLLLLSPATSAVGNTLIKRGGRDTSSVLLNRNGTLVGAALLVGLAYGLERGAAVTLSPTAVGSVVYLALVGSVLAFLLYFWLLRYAKATRMSLLTYGVPLVAVTLGVTVGGETAGLDTLAGLLGILAGVFLVLAPRRSRV